MHKKSSLHNINRKLDIVISASQSKLKLLFPILNTAKSASVLKTAYSRSTAIQYLLATVYELKLRFINEYLLAIM